MKLILLALVISTVSQSWGKVHEVSTVSQFHDALDTVEPGDTIQLASGTYRGGFKPDRSGTKDDPIILQGPEDAVVVNSGYGFYLTGSYWILRGFTVADSGKGIVIDYGGNHILEGLTVHDIDEEGIHFRFHSSDNIIRNNKVYNTGVTRPGYGEGIYIGQDRGKWPSPEEPDQCDRNQILNNTIGSDCRGEGIDLKEGTCCGRIAGTSY